jgi:hypothetical protein
MNIQRSGGSVFGEFFLYLFYFLSRELIPYTRFAWAGGTFFPVVLYVVSVFGSGRKYVLVYIHMY